MRLSGLIDLRATDRSAIIICAVCLKSGSLERSSDRAGEAASGRLRSMLRIFNMSQWCAGMNYLAIPYVWQNDLP